MRNQEIFNIKIAKFLNTQIKNKQISICKRRILVSNKFKISHPGYNDIITGQTDKNIISNNLTDNKNKSFFEEYNLKPILSPGWTKFKEIYNIKRNKFKIHNFNKFSLRKYNSNKKTNKNKKCLNLGSPKSNYKNTSDCLTFEIFCYFWKNNHFRPKCGHLAFSESDEWAHNNNFENYIATINFYDQCIEYIWTYLNPETIIITTDHGRGDKYWKSHYNNIKGSEYS